MPGSVNSICWNLHHTCIIIYFHLFCGHKKFSAGGAVGGAVGAGPRAGKNYNFGHRNNDSRNDPHEITSGDSEHPEILQNFLEKLGNLFQSFGSSLDLCHRYSPEVKTQLETLTTEYNALNAGVTISLLIVFYIYQSI